MYCCGNSSLPFGEGNGRTQPTMVSPTQWRGRGEEGTILFQLLPGLCPLSFCGGLTTSSQLDVLDTSSRKVLPPSPLFSGSFRGSLNSQAGIKQYVPLAHVWTVLQLAIVRRESGECILLSVARLNEGLFVFCPPIGDLEELKKKTFVLKEGAEYRVKIHFKVSPLLFH